MKCLKATFAPGMASFGVIAYLKGNFKKTIIRIERAIAWRGDIVEEPMYSGHLGLALLKVGEKEKAKPFLERALKDFSNPKHLEDDENQIVENFIKKIENALQNIT